MDLEVYHGMSRRYSELPAFPSRTERNCHCCLNCDQAQDSWKLFHLTNVPNFREQTTQPVMKSQSQSQKASGSPPRHQQGSTVLYQMHAWGRRVKDHTAAAKLHALTFAGWTDGHPGYS